MPPGPDDGDITIIKVPLAVAEQWHNVLLGERTSGKRCDRPLGAIDLARQQLELSEHVAADGGGLAKRYKLDSLTAAGDAETLLLTWPTQGRPGVEGRVVRSLTARPQAVDAQALSALKRLTDEAATERHTTQTDTDVVYQRQSALNAKSVVTRVEKRATISKEDFESRRDELEGKTFELFHEAPNWTTQDIAKQLKITVSQATSLLSGIAVKVQAGPMRGRWGLKAEYRQDHGAASEAMEH